MREVGGSVQFDCSISGTYQYYFDWRRHQSPLHSDVVYYTINNTEFVRGPGFPAERFHRAGDYGLRITSLTVVDGANYRCEFNLESLSASANLFVMGAYFGF